MALITENAPDGTPTWIDIGIPDLDRAMAFYGSLFGWDFDVGPAEFGRYTTCLLRGEPVAAMMPNLDEGATRFWWNVYLATADCDRTAERITAAGGTLVAEPMDAMEHGRMAIARGPDGRAVRPVAGVQAHRRADRQRAGCTGAQRPGHPGPGAGPRVLRRGLRLHPGRPRGHAGLRLHLPAPPRRARDRRDHGRPGRGPIGVEHHLRGGRHRRGDGRGDRGGRAVGSGPGHDLRPDGHAAPTRSAWSSRSSPVRRSRAVRQQRREPVEVDVAPADQDADPAAGQRRSQSADRGEGQAAGRLHDDLEGAGEHRHRRRPARRRWRCGCPPPRGG